MQRENRKTITIEKGLWKQLKELQLDYDVRGHSKIINILLEVHDERDKH